MKSLLTSSKRLMTLFGNFGSLIWLESAPDDEDEGNGEEDVDVVARRQRRLSNSED